MQARVVSRKQVCNSWSRWSSFGETWLSADQKSLQNPCSLRIPTRCPGSSALRRKLALLRSPFPWSISLTFSPKHNKEIALISQKHANTSILSTTRLKYPSYYLLIDMVSPAQSSVSSWRQQVTPLNFSANEHPTCSVTQQKEGINPSRNQRVPTSQLTRKLNTWQLKVDNPSNFLRPGNQKRGL